MPLNKFETVMTFSKDVESTKVNCCWKGQGNNCFFPQIWSPKGLLPIVLFSYCLFWLTDLESFPWATTGTKTPLFEVMRASLRHKTIFLVSFLPLSTWFLPCNYVNLYWYSKKNVIFLYKKKVKLRSIQENKRRQNIRDFNWRRAVSLILKSLLDLRLDSQIGQRAPKAIENQAK